MPTGYTAGILDGSIDTFHEFAKICTRAFGATVHLRDESLDTEYTPDKPGKYHPEQIEKAKKAIESANTLSDTEIVSIKKEELESGIKYHTEDIAKSQKNKIRLEAILSDAEKYVSPTSEHEVIKEFMVKQLKETISFDCKNSYSENRLNELNAALLNLDPNLIRAEMIEKANKDLAYHTAEFAKEVSRCEERNKWVEDFLKSL